MIRIGKQLGISSFGTGDHNHNLTDSTWLAQQEETRALQKTFPQLSLMNNCEVTFRLGHFLVIEPESITGTIEEGFSYLFGNRDAMLVITHPYLPTDSWRGSILPHVTGIEVINGAVLSSEEGDVFLSQMMERYGLSRLIDIPHIACYADYLAHGIPVVPFGSSDAHRLSELGLGVTGYWHDSLQEAISSRALFAATDTGIRLFWEHQEDVGIITWKAAIEAPSYVPDSGGYTTTVEWYRDDQFLGRFPVEGSLSTDRPGYYWFGVQQGKRYAVSAPVAVKDHPVAAPKPIYGRPLSTYHMLWSGTIVQDPLPSGSARGELYLSEDFSCHDAAGTEVKLLLQPIEHDVVIDNSGSPELLKELFLWFSRNEIHEFIFSTVTYKIDSGSLQLKAVLLPALLVHNRSNDEQISRIGRELLRLLPDIQRVELLIEAPPLFRVTLQSDHQFPLLIEDRGVGRHSRVYCEKDSHTLYQQFI